MRFPASCLFIAIARQPCLSANRQWLIASDYPPNPLNLPLRKTPMMLLPSIASLSRSSLSALRSPMKRIVLLATISLSLASSGAIAATSTPLAGAGAKQLEPDRSPAVVDGIRFACESVNGEYTVMYYPESQPDQAYAWATPTQLGGGWTPERRCNEISRRLEVYRPAGLQELQTSVENGYDIVCVTTESNPACRIVFTVPPGQDAIATRDRVFENIAVADSGQRTDGVVTYTDDGNIFNQIGDALNLDLPLGRQRSRSNSIDLRPFLDPADGGTGAMLETDSPMPGRMINPDRFR